MFFDGDQAGGGRMPPNLVVYENEEEYRLHYERVYCRQAYYTFDGLRVYFPEYQFDHAFFESANRQKRDKSTFSVQRAQRIDWIKAAIADAKAELYEGWDRDRKKYVQNRRVVLIFGNYVVILRMQKKGRSAVFVTAYVADNATITKIRTGPKWSRV